METEITYQKAIGELEQIIQKMQSNQCTIDELSALTTRSLQLLTICKNKLTKTDEELKKIFSNLTDEK